MNRPFLLICGAFPCWASALVGLCSAPHLTDPAPFATLGAAYVAMMAGSCLLALIGTACALLAIADHT